MEYVPVIMARVKRLKTGDAVRAWGMGGTVRKIRREDGQISVLVTMDGGVRAEHWFAWRDVELAVPVLEQSKEPWSPHCDRD